MHKTPSRDDDLHFFISSYDKSPTNARDWPNGKVDNDLPALFKDDNKDSEDREVVSHKNTSTQDQTAYCTTTATSGNEPATYYKAIKCPDVDLWLTAMLEELKVFKKIGLYEEVDCPPDHKIDNSKWVFKIQCGPNGKIDKYKACLVTKGFTQVQGINYTDTFTPITKFSSICMLLVLAAYYDLEIHQMDVKSAFLNGELEEEIYLHPPPGFHDKPGKVWCLWCALYSLKQASKAWYDTQQKVFESLGFTHCQANHSIFYQVEDGMPIIISVYIDDKLILSKSLDAINCLKSQLSQEYELIDLGEAHWILGMEIIQDCERQTIELLQCHYIETILEHFSMENGHAVKTPMEPNLKLLKSM